MTEQSQPEIKLGVYQAIQNTMSDLSKVGIAKEQKNVAQNFKFRGIDDVYQATSRILSKNNLVIIPRDLQRQVTERPTRNGGIQLHVVLEVEYTFVCPTDGSFHKTVATGEAMDSGDKAISKARTCAYKYLLFQTFCIPVQGEDDADASTHEIADTAKMDLLLFALSEATDKASLSKFKEKNAAIIDDLSPAETNKFTAEYAKHIARLKSQAEQKEAA